MKTKEKALRIASMFGVALCATASIAAGKTAEDTLPKIASEGEVYVYKSESGDRGQMEIFFPESHDVKMPVPGIIMFHGGGWKTGDLGQFRYLCNYFASRGLVAATANYRLGDKRICITDAKSAIRWYKQNAGELGIDPNRIIAGGGSAGGHVAMLASTNPGLNDPDDPKGIDTSVVAYLLFNPAFLRFPENTDEDILEHLTTDMPPVIAFWGTSDGWLKAWRTTYQKMISLGTSVEWWSAEGQKHAFFNKNPWRDLTVIQADRFLKKHGLIEGEPTLHAPVSGEKIVKKSDP